MNRLQGHYCQRREDLYIVHRFKTSSSQFLINETVKAKSSKYIQWSLLTSDPFEWQEGVRSFFPNSQSQIDNVYNYILNQ